MVKDLGWCLNPFIMAAASCSVKTWVLGGGGVAYVYIYIHTQSTYLYVYMHADTHCTYGSREIHIDR